MIKQDKKKVHEKEKRSTPRRRRRTQHRGRPQTPVSSVLFLAGSVIFGGRPSPSVRAGSPEATKAKSGRPPPLWPKQSIPRDPRPPAANLIRTSLSKGSKACSPSGALTDARTFRARSLAGCGRLSGNSEAVWDPRSGPAPTIATVPEPLGRRKFNVPTSWAPHPPARRDATRQPYRRSLRGVWKLRRQRKERMTKQKAKKGTLPFHPPFARFIRRRRRN